MEEAWGAYLVQTLQKRESGAPRKIRLRSSFFVVPDHPRDLGAGCSAEM